MSPGWTDERRLLVALFVEVRDRPREIVAAGRLGTAIGATYEELLRAVDALDRSGRVLRYGSARVVTDMRVAITARGYAEARRWVRDTVLPGETAA